MTIPARADERLAYALDDRFYDEAFEAPFAPRPHYAALLDGLARTDLDALELTVAADLASRGVDFAGVAGPQRFRVDPIPRLITAEEWESLERGLTQRVRALNAFVADVYGARRIFHAGVVPDRVLSAAEHYEPAMVGIPVPHGVYAAVAGLDLVRDAEGRFLVLEDNLRTPSGLAYAEAARDVLEERLPAAAQISKQTLRGVYDVLGSALCAAAPDGVDEPFVALVSDGPSNSAWFEHETIARRLAIPLVGIGDLEQRGGALCARLGDKLHQVDVLYRRTDEDRLVLPGNRFSPLGELVAEPMRRGTLACVNAFGPGIADDKLVHAYVEDMVRFYLGDEPAIASVPTYDLAHAEARRDALGRLDELVVKPRTGHGGHGVVIGPHASNDELERVREAISRNPGNFIAQETVPLSRHPTICAGRLAPRHVDLRPFVISAGDQVTAVPGGLTRVAFRSGVLVVNSSQDGGGKDTWVLE